jgi:hypothetical protein
MEEPPRIEKVTSSRGVSLADAGSILDSFINTLDSQGHGASQAIDASPSTPTKAEAATSTTAAATPRKSYAELEEESILKQFDLLTKQNTGLVSDDTYERLKLIRDSIAGEVEGRVLKPSLLKKKDDEHQYNSHIENYQDAGADESQQFINELEEAEQELIEREEESRRSAKKAKKEKKSAKKAKKEAKKKRKQDSLRESEDGDVGEKRIKLEEDS